MANSTPPSPGSPYNPLYPVDLAVDADLANARQALHITDPTTPLIGFSNGIKGYQNACYRNSIVALLVNLPPLAGWIASNSRGQLDASPTARILENVIRDYFATPSDGKQTNVDRAIQRLYHRFNIRRPTDYKKPESRYGVDTQQDAGEALAYVLHDIQEELVSANDIRMPESSYSRLLQMCIVAQLRCVGCQRATNFHDPAVDEEHWNIFRLNLTLQSLGFRELIAATLSTTAPAAYCKRCATIQPRDCRWKILKTPEIILFDINQISEAGRKPGHQVPTIPDTLDLDEYLHEDATANGETAHYRLVGIVNHQGANAQVGHYASHIQHIAGTWCFLDDSIVTPSSATNAQRYVKPLKNKQMIPRLIAYVKIHQGEDRAAIATRTKTADILPRPFIHPQINYDEALSPSEHKALCRSHGLIMPGNMKKAESIRNFVDGANATDSKFSTRTKDWLIRNLLDAGESVKVNQSKDQLAAQMRKLIKSQPSKPKSKEDTSLPRGEAANSDTANSTIANLQQALALAQRDLIAANTRAQQAEYALYAALAGPTDSSPPQPTTDYIRGLVRRIPAATSPRGTKRPEEEANLSPREVEKRRILLLADDACAAVDVQLERGHVNSRSTSEVGNQTDNNGKNIYLSQLHDLGPSSNAENQPLSTGSPRRCHRCPQHHDQIHHMHELVCGGASNGDTMSVSQALEPAINITNLTAPEQQNEATSDESQQLMNLPDDSDITKDWLNGDVSQTQDRENQNTTEGTNQDLQNNELPEDGDLTIQFLNQDAL